MNVQNQYSKEAINKAQEIAEIQDHLFNLTEENYISTISFLNGSQYLDSSYHETFLQNLFWALQLRPKSICLLFDLFIWFSSNEDISTEKTIKTVISTFFIRCHTNYEDHSKFVYSFFCGIFKLLDETFDSESTDEKYINEFIEKLIKAKEDEIDKIKKAISFQSNDLLSIIYHDDIQKFSEISSKPEFDINMKISNQSLFLFSIDENMSLIEVASILGSVQIFKYIVVNEGIINTKQQFSKYSIWGGCTEIIRIIEQKGFKFKEIEIGEASYYHQLGIIQWILDSKGVSNVNEAIKKCALSNFIEGLLFFENNQNEFSKDFYNCKNLVEWAAKSGSYDVLNFLLSSNIHELNNTIFSVVEFGDLLSANLLKERFHSFINKSNKIHLKPIHIAAQKGDTFMCHFLINNFPELELNAQDRYGATVLHLSIRFNKLNAFEIFMKNKSVDVNLCDFGDTSPLHEAVMSDNHNFVKMLLEDERTNVNIEDQNGRTALIEAIDKSEIELVELFLKSNKKIEKFVDAINASINKENSEITKLLIYSNKIDINDGKIVGLIIDKIIEKEKYQYIKYFIDQKRFNINLQFGNESKTILHLCCSIKELYFLIPIILERNDVDVNIHDSSGLTPLHEAMRSQNNDFSVFLIKDKRVDVNAKDNGNQTPLHYAASNWSIVPLTDLLLHQKIDPNIIDKDGKTALFIACELGVVDSVEILLNDYKVDTEIEIESIFFFSRNFWSFFFKFF